MTELSFGIVGCGAVAGAHVPILAETSGVRTGVLVDKNLDRARKLAASCEDAEAIDDHRRLAGMVDAAVVALPHHLHAPVAIDLLEQGVHVLVEKPMALKVEECEAMIAAARSGGAVLAVGLLSRWLAVGSYVKRLLDSGILGRIESFEVREGSVYDWPVASDFMFRREAGGGVLADTGAHVLDVLLWWLGDHVDFEYRDDAQGGVEADCELRLELAGGARGTVELSRTRDLGNHWVLRGERGMLVTQRKFDAELRLELAGEAPVVEGRIVDPDGGTEDPLDCFRRQIADFRAAVLEGREPMASGAEGRRSVALIEACHASRQPLAMPWDDPRGAVSAAT